MHDHPQAEIDLLPTIMEFFDLDEVRAIEPITMGLSNHNYLVSTSQNEYYVRFTQNQTLEQIENDIAIQSQLQKTGVLAPQYMQNQQGDKIFSKDPHLVVVSPKVPGVIKRQAITKLVYSIGETLAKFHAAVTELPHPAKGWMHFDESKIRSSDVQALAKADLPSGITHGDMHLYNVYVLPQKPDEVYAIFDFEEVGEDLYLVDLARSIIGVCHTPDGDKLDPKLVEAEINGYQAIRKLNKDEKRLLPQAVGYAAQACINWFVAHGFEKYVPAHRSRAASFVSPFE